jgi:acetyltransferase-like isoleucine patch superfamily enzyme
MSERNMAQKQAPKRVNPEYNEMGMTQWYWRVSHRDNFKLGNNTEIGTFTMIDALNGVTIEDDVKIGFSCTILSNSTIDDKYAPVILKKGCKLGANSVVMPGITIGEGAVVGSNSFVNRDIPPKEMWFGSPVRFYKKLGTQK